VKKPHGCGFSTDASAHEYRRALARRHTTALCPRSGARDVEYIWDWKPVKESSLRSDSTPPWRCKAQRSALSLSLEQCLVEVKSWKRYSNRRCPVLNSSNCNTAWPWKLQECCLMTVLSCNSQACWSSGKSPRPHARQRPPRHRAWPP
jgi:hypothetical protein